MNGLGAGGAQGPGGMGGAGGAVAGFPAPAGYTAELSYIHAMVEELSRQLSDNKRVLDDVVTGVGRVRNRAHTQQLGNEELIGGASEELQDQESNLDATISVLSEALDAARYAKDANAQLVSQYANVLAGMLKQFHEYKQKHVADVAAWHRSYRHQLAEARAENCRLRDQIWEMQESAGRANASLRAFRSAYDENPARWERRVADKATRQELRFWKRMAMPTVADDDLAYWSDDDDLIDSAEKVRLREVERKQLEEQRQIMQQQQQRALQLQQQQQQQQQHEEQMQQQRHQREMEYQQQQQQQELHQQQQYEKQMAFAAATAAAASTTTAGAPDGRGDDIADARGPFETTTEIQIGRDDDGQELGEIPRGSGNAWGASDGVDLDDDDLDDDLDDLEDNGIDLEGDLSSRLPAVPQAPSSALPPAGISRIGSSGGDAPPPLTAPDADGVDKGTPEEGATADLPPRPSSAAGSDSGSSDGSTGSMESTGSDDL